MIKNKLLWVGSIIIGTASLLIIYFTFNILGITQSPINSYKLVIKTESLEKRYDGTPLTSNNWWIQSGELLPGHTMEVIMNASITEPGSIPNEIGVTIYDAERNNVTSKYNVVYNLGTLSILRHDLIIKTETLEKLYDGTPLTSNIWWIHSGQLLPGHRINGFMNKSITNPGSIDNEVGINIIDEESNDVSKYYNIIYDLGKLTILKHELTIKTESLRKIYDGRPLTSTNWWIQNGRLLSGHRIEGLMTETITEPGSIDNKVGITILDTNNNDVSFYYNITYDFGTLTVLKRDITIQTESLEKTYDGIALTSDKWWFHSGELAPNHRIVATMNNSITNPGSIENKIGITIYDSNNVDVTNYYNINYELGTLTILKFDLTIETESLEKDYDGTPLTSEKWWFKSGQLVSNHRIEVTMNASITNAGSIPNKIGVTILDENNNNVTNMYNITYDLGTLTVLKIELSIRTETLEKYYDGIPLTSNNWELLTGQLIPNHRFETTMKASITNPGTIKNSISVSIYDANNNNVTNNYKINYNLGTLTILKHNLTIKTESLKKLYDGTPLTSNNWWKESGNLLSGHRIEGVMTESITEPGTVNNKVQITIYDENNNNVTNIYNINYDLGTLTILKHDLLIKTESLEKTYDGEPLTSNNWQLISGNLLPGHRIEGVMTKSITYPGSIKNEVTIIIYDENNNNVTNKYKIAYDLGTLTISKRNITIQTESLTKTYDGIPLTSNRWSLQSGELLPGHAFDATMTSSITEPGSISNKVGITIYDANKNDVTNYYKITYDLGTLTISKRSITIETESLSKMYDGKPLTSKNWSIKSGELLLGHSISTIMNATITNAGSVTNTIGITIYDKNNINVTNYYKITYILGTLEITKRNLSIQTENKEKNFDGTPLTSNSWWKTSGELVDGHTINAVMTSSITFPGSIKNEIGITILDSSHNDVTNNYKITYTLGKLTVNKINLIIQSCSANKVYDGTPLTCSEWKLIKGDLLENHELEVEVVGKITDVGTVENSIQAYIVDKSGDIVTSYYNIDYLPGKLTILSSVYSSGDLLRNSPEISDEVFLQIYTTQSGLVYLRDKSWGSYNGKGWGIANPYNNTGFYNPLSFSSVALSDYGKIAYPIQIKHLKDYIPYLMPYYATNNYVDLNDVHVYGQVKDIYSFNYIPFNYGPSTNISLQRFPYTEEENLYREYVYTYYLEIPLTTRLSMLQIAYENGLNPTSPTIIFDVQRYIQNAARYNLDFAPIPEDVNDIAVYFLTESKEGICQHFATAATLMYRALGIPARYVTGFVGNGVANKWSDIKGNQAHAWVEVYIDGMGWVQIEVTGAYTPKTKITVTPKDVKVLYTEGMEPIRASQVYISGFSEYLSKGYTYSVTFEGELANVGIETSSIKDFTIFDELGNDVTYMFDITYRLGILQVYQNQITFSTKPAYKTYDGTSLTNHEWEITGELENGHKIAEVVFTGEQLYVGASQNLATIKIVDEDGNDVTAMYLINYDLGMLVVNPRQIIIESKSATKPYDGIALTCHEFEIVDSSLAYGEEIEVVIKGEQKSIGSSDNVIESVRIFNGTEDVTNNYIIEYIEGKLTVTPPNN